jgi:hypothetical protein
MVLGAPHHRHNWRSSKTMDEKRTPETGTQPQDEIPKQGGASGSPDKGDSTYRPGQGGLGGSGWQPGQTERAGGTSSQPGQGGLGGSQPSDPKEDTERATDGSES